MVKHSYRVTFADGSVNTYLTATPPDVIRESFPDALNIVNLDAPDKASEPAREVEAAEAPVKKTKARA